LKPPIFYTQKRGTQIVGYTGKGKGGGGGETEQKNTALFRREGHTEINGPRMCGGGANQGKKKKERRETGWG